MPHDPPQPRQARRTDIVRSKTGCLTCRRRHKKCDERKPTCRNCERNLLECDGYQSARRWRPPSAGRGQTNNTQRVSSPQPVFPVTQDDNHALQPVLQGRDERASLAYTLSENSDVSIRSGSSQRHVEGSYSDMRQEGLSPDTQITSIEGNSISSRRSLAGNDSVAIEAYWADSASPEITPATLRAQQSASRSPTHGSAPVNESSALVGQSHANSLTRITLPSIIDGIETALDRRLLHHFTEVVAKGLVVTPEATLNPFTRLIVPLALRDTRGWGLLELILSLSASHLSRLMRSKSEGESWRDLYELERSKWKYYSCAVTLHAKNMSYLMHANHIDTGRSGESQIDYAIATTMLLCQWCTCEGGDQADWRMHLIANRDLVRRRFDTLGDVAPAPLSDASQTLLEWFYFHDVIAALTSPGQTCCINLHERTVEAHGISVSAIMIPEHFESRPPEEIMWIGVNDGLLALASRTLTIRNMARYDVAGERPIEEIAHETSSEMTGVDQSRQWNENRVGTLTRFAASGLSSLDSHHLLEALSIETALENWNYQYMTPQQQTVGQCYRLATFLLLYFTIHPRSTLDNGKVQACVSQLVSLIRRISERDSAITCCLFPLFMCGVTAIQMTDFELVLAKMTAYGSWCGLGHVGEVTKFLRAWWKVRDYHGDGYHGGTSQSWWGWQDLMKEHRVDLILI